MNVYYQPDLPSEQQTHISRDTQHSQLNYLKGTSNSTRPKLNSWSFFLRSAPPPGFPILVNSTIYQAIYTRNLGIMFDTSLHILSSYLIFLSFSFLINKIGITAASTLIGLKWVKGNNRCKVLVKWLEVVRIQNYVTLIVINDYSVVIIIKPLLFFYSTSKIFLN